MVLKDCFETMKSSNDEHQTRKPFLIQTAHKDCVMFLRKYGHRNKRYGIRNSEMREL
jgi:hypothetical protein